MFKKYWWVDINKNKNKNKKNKNTKAKFICALTIKLENGRELSSIGKINGNISKKIIGKNGFGYDPIFIPRNHEITFGQMRKRKKMMMDHRFLAFKNLRAKINFL